jgi:hypothetical protein
MRTKVILQSQLDSSCFMVQAFGTGEGGCKACEMKGKPDCGGKAILAQIKKGKYPKDGLPDQNKK